MIVIHAGIKVYAELTQHMSMNKSWYNIVQDPFDRVNTIKSKIDPWMIIQISTQGLRHGYVTPSMVFYM